LDDIGDGPVLFIGFTARTQIEASSDITSMGCTNEIFLEAQIKALIQAIRVMKDMDSIKALPNAIREK